MNLADIVIQIPGYIITEQLYASTRTLVYRGQRQSDFIPVVVKLLRNEHPCFNELIQFRNQFTITKNLNLAGVVQPYSLEPYGNSYALVMEDFGGMALSKYRPKHQQGGQPNSAALPPIRFAVPDFLAIALQLADILNGLYRHRIIHKDLKPANILINPETKQVKLIDFSIASLLPRETQEIQSPNVLEGTLAYLSPEQTGRMNRGIDYRSDFYSLGVTLFELLTGQLPFQTTDPLEMIHSHVAKHPPAVHDLNPDISPVLSALISKLMAKNAEDRYQSTLGLKRDLEKCLLDWKETSRIASFELGQRDVCDRFAIPEKLYGRQIEVEALLSAFDRVSNGKAEMVLVAGFSGIGKTAVVNEVHKPIVRQRGYFIKGKYDQFQRNIPFSAFVQAFRDLMGQLLSETDAQLKQWRHKILSALGETGQVMIEVIPELERIIGSQPPVPELSGSAAQNRFNRLFQQFLQVFTAAEHPLVIFIDDLQWADSASLKLMQLLISQANTRYLLFIGAYRDNEVTSAHPLMLTLEAIQEAETTVSTISLAPLDQEAVNQLIADTLSCTSELALPLTKLVISKTEGNPFFSTQFLKALYDEGLLTFNFGGGYWEFDIAKVRSLALTEDVVEFMAIQLQKLPVATQQVLRLAACVGNQFDLTTLAIVHEQSQTTTAADLWRALQDGLVIPISEIYKFYHQASDETTLYVDQPAAIPSLLASSQSNYRFLHDRVQQAAYSLIPEDQKQTTHLKIGQLLLKSSSSEEREERLFEIVNQLNTGRQLITEPSERFELAQLNLAAGLKAKTSTAYTTAADYLKTGIELLGEESWQQSYELTLPLHRQLAEVEFLCGNFDHSVALVNQIVSEARQVLEQAEAYNLLVVQHTFLGNYTEAIETGIKALSLLGMNISDDLKPAIQQEIQIINSYLRDRSVLALLDQLSETADPKIRIAVQLLVNLDPPVYITSNLDLYILVSAKIVALSLEHGYIPETVKGYGNYGWLSGIVLGDYKTGYDFGVLGMTLARKLNNSAQLSKVSLSFGSWIHNWSRPVWEILHVNDEGYRAGLESGEVLFGGWNLFCKVTNLLFGGTSLDTIDENLRKYLPFAIKTQNEFLFGILASISFLTQELVEADQSAAVGQNEGRVELAQNQFIASCEESQNFCSLSFYYICQMQLSCINQTFRDGLNYALAAKRTLQGALGFTPSSEYPVYESLILLNLYLEATPTEQAEYLQQVQQNQTQYKVWTDNCPENFLHKYLLVEAELNRVTGEVLKAIDCYDRAIGAARESRFTHIEALANEMAARFYLDWDKPRIAQDYLINAYYAYSYWGATAKVKDLEHRYSSLLSPILQSHSSLTPTETITSLKATSPFSSGSLSTSDSGVSAALDLTTALKASQILSSEIQLEKLLSTLLHMVIENAGAEKCVLMLLEADALRDTKGERLAIEGVAQMGQPSIVLQSIAVEESQDIPISLVNTVKRTLQPAIILDAMNYTALAADPYILQQQPKSVSCVPILHQAKLLGILYLENNQTTGAFTRDRVELLNLLCSQAAISLENARLYAREQEKTQALQTSLQELQQSQSRFQRLFEKSADAILLLNDNGFIACNQAAVKLLGYTHTQQLCSTHPSQISPEFQPDGNTSFDKAEAMIAEALCKGSHQFEWVHQRANGENFWAEVMLTLIPYDGEQVLHSIVRDISERKRIEAALQEQEQFLRSIYEGVGALIFVFDVLQDGDFCCTGWSLSAEQATKLRTVDVIGKNPEGVFGSGGVSTRQNYRRCVQAGTSITYEECLAFDDQNTWWLTTLNPLRNVEGKIYRLVGTMININDRKAAESALQDSEASLRLMIDSVQDYAIIRLEPDGTIATWNIGAERTKGYTADEAIGQHLSIFYTPEDIERNWVQQVLQLVIQHHKYEEEGWRIRKDGSRFWANVDITALWNTDGQLRGFSKVTRDITERKQAEELLRQSAAELRQRTGVLENTLSELQNTQMQLVQSEKMSALGNLVAGIAHEINNPVGFIAGNLSPAKDYIRDVFGLINLYQQKFPQPGTEIEEEIQAIDLEYLREDLPKLIDSMKLGVERIRSISTSLRTFSRADKDYKVPFNLHEGIDSTILILKHRLKANNGRPAIEVAKDYGELPPVECFAGQLNQVFMNLLANAIDALEESDKRRSETTSTPNRITIQTRLVNEGQHVLIEIADNGIGMPELIKQQIFDHLFTTKPVGQGTGLGLAIARQIVVEKHQGTIEVDSAPGEGTKFVITLPVKKIEPRLLEEPGFPN